MEEARISGRRRGLTHMNARAIPVFDDWFPDLNQFILDLAAAYEAGKIPSWENLEARVKAHFTAERMQHMETVVPGWRTMASYTGGITLVHVMCVFLGMFMLPEFRALTPEQKQMAKWIILLHDIAKFHIPGIKDTMHAFHSGVQAANLLPRFGFPTRHHYLERIRQWSHYVNEAFLPTDTTPKPDNRKLPGILIGIDNLFGKDKPAALIIKTVLLHISLDIDPFYPTPAPLTEAEAKRYINSSLLPLLRLMMLSDNEGWSMFDHETRTRQRRDTLNAFEKLEGMISYRGL